MVHLHDTTALVLKRKNRVNINNTAQPTMDQIFVGHDQSCSTLTTRTKCASLRCSCSQITTYGFFDLSIFWKIPIYQTTVVLLNVHEADTLILTPKI